MRLVEFDDYPFHQVPTPFSVSGTSDVHFNDGYWFSTYAEGWYLAAGLRLHPNTNVMDCFASVAREGEQTAVRASRVLRPDMTMLAVGPMRLEILEPMRRHRLSLTEAPIDLAFELEFEAFNEALLETPYEHRKFGHLINQLVRYTQVCRASGHIRHDEEEAGVDHWHAMRDHSWGLRSTMGPRTPHGGIEPHEMELDHRRFRLWVPFQTTAHTGFFHTHEAQHGETLDFEGRLTAADGSSVRLVGCKHALEYHPGTRQVAGGTLVLADENGGSHQLELTPSGTPADVQGFGYYGGWHDGGSAGVWRGIGPVVEHDRYPVKPDIALSGPPHVETSRRLGPTEFPCRVVEADGSEGMAHFEHHIFGRYEPYERSR
jgi:hypothetical protein